MNRFMRASVSVGSGSRITKRGLWLLVAALVLTSVAPLGAQQPQLVPQPREIRPNNQKFLATGSPQIVLSSANADEDRYAAESLNEELEHVTGHRFPITSSPSPSGSPIIRLARFEDAQAGNLLASTHLDVEGIGEQGYILDVERDRVLVAGKDGPGLFYGVQTLRQLVRPAPGGAEIAGVRVKDWPTLVYRGTQVDMSRGPAPNLNYLKRIVRTIAQFKMNLLFVYLEDTFRLKGQPLVGVLSDTLSPEDWKELVSYARGYHVDIIPATQACGHMHKVMRFEQYSGLAERPHGHVFAADDSQVLAFLNQMYGQMASVFPFSIYNIGCDETYELGKGRSAAQVEKQGYGRVYVDSVTRVHDLVRSFNKQVMFWGDIALEHPEMIKQLPRDLIVASWEYSAHPDYNKWLTPFQGTGTKIFVCPWVGNTSQMVPDYEEAAYNIETFLRDGKKAGAIGTDVTVWNDDGESLYGPNWWSIVYGAACAWEPGKTDVANFDGKFDWVFYRNTDHRFTEAIKKLGHLNEVMRGSGSAQAFDMHYGGTNDALFWRDPFSPAGQADVKKALPVVSEVRRTAEQVYTVLANDAGRAQRNADTLADLQFAALKLDALGMRYQFVQEISERYADALSQAHGQGRRGVASNLSDISSTNGRLQDLRDYTTRLRELYRELWLSENLPSWLPNMLQLYDRNSRLWQDLIAKFAAIRYDLGQGKALPAPESLGLIPVPPPK
jgi:hexosaminidase